MDKTLARSQQTISLADRLDARLADLKKTIAGWPEEPAAATVDRESARSQLRMLESLAAKMTLETDFPADRLLANLEAQTAAADRSRPFLGKDRAGQFWVTVVTKSRRRVAMRVFVPRRPPPGQSVADRGRAPRGRGKREHVFRELRPRCDRRPLPRARLAAGRPSQHAVRRRCRWSRSWTSWPNSIQLTSSG